MEAFEKKWEDWDCDINCDIGECDSCKKLAEYWYRVALEMVKREAISLDERGDSIRNVINKELEEE